MVPTRSTLRRQLSRYTATSDSRVSAAIHSCCRASPRMRSMTPSSFGAMPRSGRFSSSRGSFDGWSAAVAEAKYRIFVAGA